MGRVGHVQHVATTLETTYLNGGLQLVPSIDELPLEMLGALLLVLARLAGYVHEVARWNQEINETTDHRPRTSTPQAVTSVNGRRDGAADI